MDLGKGDIVGRIHGKGHKGRRAKPQGPVPSTRGRKEGA